MPKVCIWVSRRVSFAGVVVLRRTVYRKEKKKRTPVVVPVISLLSVSSAS